MASHPPNECCTDGFVHEGIPSGRAIKVGQWGAYLAHPQSEKQRNDVVVLYLPDVMGLWHNSKLQADRFAENGYVCLAMDLFNGDPVQLPHNRPKGFNLQKWMAHGSDGNNPHTTIAVDPMVESAIKYVKEELGAKKIACASYCFGAKYLARHYKTGINVGYMAHPAFVEEEELAAITGPLAIAAAEDDDIFPDDMRHKSESILARTGLPWQMYLYGGVSHGFATRGNMNNMSDRFARDQAFRQAVTWFQEHGI